MKICISYANTLINEHLYRIEDIEVSRFDGKSLCKYFNDDDKAHGADPRRNNYKLSAWKLNGNNTTAGFILKNTETTTLHGGYLIVGVAYSQINIEE